MNNNWSEIEHIDLTQAATTMRIGILSDTHGWLDSQVKDILQDCDIVLHAGDICGATVLQELREAAPRVIAIAGNNDVPVLWNASEHDEVMQLVGMVKIALPGGDLAMEHGHRFGDYPDHEKLRDAWPGARMIVYGHTHRQVFDDDANCWVVNPGAAGRERVKAGPSCATLDINDAQWSVNLHCFELNTREWG